MAVQYSSSRILSRGGQRMGLRNFSIPQAQPGAAGIVLLTTDAPFNWNAEIIRWESDTGKRRRRTLRPLRRSPKGLIYLRLPRLATGRYTLAAKPEGVDESWVRLYVTDGTPPSPDQETGHRIDSLGASAAATLELLLADLEHLIGDTPLIDSGGSKSAFGGSLDECFINHTPGCTSGSTEDGHMPDGPGGECTGGLGGEGDNACSGSGIYGQHEEEPCAAFDLACGMTTQHNPMPCQEGTDAFDIPICIFEHEEEPCSNDHDTCSAAHVPVCTVPSINMMDAPVCANPPADNWIEHDPPCGFLLGQPTYIFSPPGPCSFNHPFNCNLIHVGFGKAAAKSEPPLTGLARTDLPDHIHALFGSRFGYRGVPAKRIKSLAEAAKLTVPNLRLAIDLLNAAADVSVALFDEVQANLQAEGGNE